MYMCHFPPCPTCDMRESSIFHSCLWSGFGELAGVWVNLSSTRISKLPSKTRPEPDLTKLEVIFYQFGLGLVSGYFRLSLVGMNVNPTRPTSTQPTQPELSPWGCPRIHACGHVGMWSTHVGGILDIQNLQI